VATDSQVVADVPAAVVVAAEDLRAASRAGRFTTRYERVSPKGLARFCISGNHCGCEPVFDQLGALTLVAGKIDAGASAPCVRLDKILFELPEFVRGKGRRLQGRHLQEREVLASPNFTSRT
jgi:hypothetical protein